MAIVILKKGEGRTIKAGGAWIFDNEIDRVDGSFEQGDIVRVRDFDGYEMGYGFINTRSKITVRMLSRRGAEITGDFIKERVRAAWEYRKKTVDTSSCRVIFGEADFLPGIVVDKFEDVLVVESLALGIDRLKPVILDSLREIMAEDGISIRGIYERSDAPVRKKEGMEPFKGFIGEEFDTEVEITENDVRFLVDVKDGQKTGFFLDQKYNRRAVRGLAKGGRVLDCFTHTGSFALNAYYAGAKEVTGVDVSETACEQARKNARLNGFTLLEDLADANADGGNSLAGRKDLAGGDTLAGRAGDGRTITFKCADVLDLLPKLEAAGERYDLVILDPPAFTKSREATKKAVKGYRDINMRGLKLVKNGGFFATCSCSHFMTEELFKKTVQEAARAAHKRLKQVEFRTQSPDHPILWASDSSYYLKFMIFQVVEEL
ncbi:MAG: class I SAM-dependent rRNA methyltransferase [Eubacteriales bacterium]|nr:class I SAM-dependent rRNA methyltransferase [Eubacteriales bacterium]